MKNLFNQEYSLSYVNTRFCLGLDGNPHMPEEAQKLLFKILLRINLNVIEKFERGQLEHGGNLLERDLLKDLHDESIDQLVYSTAMQIKNKIQL